MTKSKSVYHNLKSTYKIKYIESQFNSLSKSKLSEEDNQKFKDNGYSSTYGELTINGYKMLKEHFPKDFGRKYNLVDLGSGNGKVQVMSIYFDNDNNIELSKERKI